MARRDYSLLGADADRARATGLASARWYQTALPADQMKALVQRRDQPAIRDTLILFAAMAAGLAGGIALWGSAWSLPFWAVYGVLYGSAMDARWHECGHGTAFKTVWMNNALYQFASFCMVRNPHTWRYSHTRHHADTLIVGRDPEIAAQRPPDLFKLGMNVFGVFDALDGWRRMLLNACGRLDPDETDYIPQARRGGVFAVARVWVAIYALTLICAWASASWLPLMVIGMPRLYGAWHHVMTGLLQHGGLADNVVDHRLNSRTVMMNPVSRFIYWNMNYHIEHHMFPMVPFHQLPALHAAMAHDCPAPNPSMWQAWREEVLPAFVRQRRDPDWFLERELPPGARPYVYRPEDLPVAGPAS